MEFIDRVDSDADGVVDENDSDADNNGLLDGNVTRMVIEGSIAHLNAALASVTYTPIENFNTQKVNETITITANDLGNGGGDPTTITKSLGITVAGVNDPVEAAMLEDFSSAGIEPIITIAGSSDAFDFNANEMAIDSETKVVVFKYDAANDNGSGQTEYSFELPVNTEADILMAGGGGSGGMGLAGGGGAGGVVYIQRFDVDASETYVIKVGKGAGGVGPYAVQLSGASGKNTMFHDYEAFGGGGGGRQHGSGASGKDGGSGGGGGHVHNGGQSIQPMYDDQDNVYAFGNNGGQCLPGVMALGVVAPVVQEI